MYLTQPSPLSSLLRFYSFLHYSEVQPSVVNLRYHHLGVTKELKYLEQVKVFQYYQGHQEDD